MVASNRNYGIDLLRIVSMIMVVILHILSQGGMIEQLSHLSVKHCVVWFMEIAAYCAVNCYALISGFTGYGRKFKPSGIVSLWFQVIFYTVGITVLFKLFSNTTYIGIYKLISSFLPVTFNYYWYFTAYFALFFITPVLNHIVETLSEKRLFILIITLVSVFSIFSTMVGNLFSNDIFNINDGYSFIWLAILYIIGAFIKKREFGFKIKSRIWVITYFICVLITLFVTIFIPVVTNKFNIFIIFDKILINYASPTILLCAISLLIIFAKLNLKEMCCKLVSFFSTASFAVYIIHVHPCIWEFIKNRFIVYIELNVFLMVLAVIITAIAIWLVCSMVDKIRQFIFKIIKFDLLAIKISKLIEKLVNKIANGLSKLCS